ncbi:MAG TPA: type I-C CRISPR-associated protein Cas8c/Csd1 [Verrucomicrobiae bacterium]|nr:type I-C CRISPR-associated protein Cas8c/Csd1 [Verrucomicrobiae bacterium]
MISELIRVAELNRITGWEAVRRRPIQWIIDLDSEGRVLNVSQTTRSVAQTNTDERKDVRGKEFLVSANYYMQWKDLQIQSVGTNQHNWLPDFLTAPADEMFDDGVDGTNKFRHKRKLFWRLIFKAHSENPQNKTIRSVWRFLKSRPKLLSLPLPSQARQNLDWFRKKQSREGETISFRVNGRIAILDFDLRRWWAEQVRKQRAEVREQLPCGKDAYEPGEGRITKYFPNVFTSVPFASFGSATFTSYGLGNQTATMRLETAEKLAAGLNWLLSREDSSLRLADETAVFWSVRASKTTDGVGVSPVPFVRLLEKADSLAVRDFLRGIWGGRPIEINVGKFFAATFAPAGKGRFSVRSWHTDTLPRAQDNLKKWFTALSLDSQEEGTPTLNQLAEATISKAKRQKSKPAPATYSALFESALFGQPLPHQIFAAAISRQEVEMAGQDHNAKPFSERLRARTSLIQLYFTLNKGIIMNESYDKTAGRPEHRTAFLCGRLLAVLDHIHNEAHEGKSASSPATRLYGAASKTPALAFPQLCQLVRHHLDKLPKYKRDRFQDGVPAAKREDGVNEDFEGLSDVVSQLNEAAGGAFPRMLSLEEQGVFAIGFYHQRKRCENWPHFKKSEKANQQPETSTPTI